MAKEEEQVTTPVNGDPRVTPEEVQKVEFRLSFRGYRERDVDAFLDRVTEDLAAYQDENRRLRAEVAAATSTTVPSGDLGAARSEAERIITEAREEASRIVREAELRASVSGAGGGDPRAAVAPFLNKEREFLQSLGGIVQTHAEEIKQMVLSVRAKAGTPQRAEDLEPASAESDAVQPAGSGGAEPEEDASADDAPVTVPDTNEAPTTEEEAFAPITLPAADDEATEAPAEEPAPATTLRTDSGDRSLRELFWGED